MSSIAALLDKAKETRSLPSDMALAAELHVSRSIVSEWRKGTKPVPDDRICALASMAGEDPGLWLVAVHADTTNGPTRKAWRGLASRLGLAAMHIMSMLGLSRRSRPPAQSGAPPE